MNFNIILITKTTEEKGKNEEIRRRSEHVNRALMYGKTMIYYEDYFIRIAQSFDYEIIELIFDLFLIKFWFWR